MLSPRVHTPGCIFLTVLFIAIRPSAIERDEAGEGEKNGEQDEHGMNLHRAADNGVSGAIGVSS
jgi:hypothetical protein